MYGGCSCHLDWQSRDSNIRLPHSPLCSHVVPAFSWVHRTQHLPTWWQTTYEQALLTNPSIILHDSNTLNAATSLPHPDNGEHLDIPQGGLAVIEMVSKSQEHLSDITLDKPDLLLFCDGPCKWHFSENITSYVIVSPHETLEAYSLPTAKSAQLLNS